jgi:hypothetical protein
MEEVARTMCVTAIHLNSGVARIDKTPGPPWKSQRMDNGTLWTSQATAMSRKGVSKVERVIPLADLTAAGDYSRPQNTKISGEPPF